MRIVFVGGGSGGHFYPLIAIAEAIREKDQATGLSSELYYMGPNAFNAEVLKSHDIKFVYIPAGKSRVYRSILNFFDYFKTIAGIFAALFKLYVIYPDVIMSKGGYTSVPIILAATVLRIPIIIHESDAIPGRANKLAARFARYIGIAQADVATHFPTAKVALVGMPIRKAFFEKVPDPYTTLNIPKDRPVILITGGSLGAARINDLIVASLTKLLPFYTVIHQVGDTQLEKVNQTVSALIEDKELLNHYFTFGHMDQEQFVAAEQAASLVISRAGSTSIFEIALLGKPSIIIPIPEGISRDQYYNAQNYAKSGACVVMEEHNMSDDLLLVEIERILTNETTYQAMSVAAQNFTSTKAADTLADTIRSVAQEHER